MFSKFKQQVVLSLPSRGAADYGGNSSQVQEQLVNVQQIQATLGAFAAIRSNGTVVTWGDPRFGGHSSQVEEQLTDVQQVQATSGAFAAIKGSCRLWRQQQPGAGAAGECPTNSSNTRCICCHQEQRHGSDLGRSEVWRAQQPSSGATD